MEKYSHGEFQVTGYKVTVHNPQEETVVIAAAWEKFKAEKIGESVLEKEYESLHAVYFNYVNPDNLTAKGYDMLLGYVTKNNSVQTGSGLITITIPAQDYKYVTLKGDLQTELVKKWAEINKMPKEELNRAYGYDMDMYNVNGEEVTVAVSEK